MQEIASLIITMEFTRQTLLVLGVVILSLRIISLKVVPVMEYIVTTIAKIGQLRIILLMVTVIKLMVFTLITGHTEPCLVITHLQDTHPKTYT